MSEGSQIKDVVDIWSAVMWIFGGLLTLVTWLGGKLWWNQDAKIAALDEKLNEHIGFDDGKFSECGNHRSAEIGALYRHIDVKHSELGKKIDDNHRELNGHIIEILKQVGGAR
jgi:hypothetical protein